MGMRSLISQRSICSDRRESAELTANRSYTTNTGVLETAGKEHYWEDIHIESRKLAAEMIGIDSHIDTVQRVLVMGEDLGKRQEVGHVDIPRLRGWNSRAILRLVGSRLLFGSGGSASDAGPTRCNAIGAGFLTLEGGHAIDDDLRVLRMYYQLGIRSMTLPHSRRPRAQTRRWHPSPATTRSSTPAAPCDRQCPPRAPSCLRRHRDAASAAHTLSAAVKGPGSLRAAPAAT